MERIGGLERRGLVGLITGLPVRAGDEQVRGDEVQEVRKQDTVRELDEKK